MENFAIQLQQKHGYRTRKQYEGNRERQQKRKRKVVYTELSANLLSITKLVSYVAEPFSVLCCSPNMVKQNLKVI